LTLANQIQQACEALGLCAELGFIAKFDGSPELQTVAKITGPRSESRMLIFRNFEDIEPFTSHLASAGFGYSVMDEPRSEETFDLESWRETFRDWSLLPS
jgi:hypothetical protein